MKFFVKKKKVLTFPDATQVKVVNVGTIHGMTYSSFSGIKNCYHGSLSRYGKKENSNNHKK